MFHYAEEHGEEQQLGTKYLRFSEISIVSVMTMETLVGSHYVV